MPVPRPKPEHAHIARNIFLTLLREISVGYYVDKEFAFRPASEHEVWVADVAAVDASLWQADNRADWFAPAPALVVEVLSPSNTAQEMIDKETVCFAGGCRQFWLVDPRHQQIRVSRPDGAARIYCRGEALPLDEFGGGTLTVALVFAP